MEKGTKTALWILGGLVFLTASGFGIKALLNASDAKNKQKEDESKTPEEKNPSYVPVPKPSNVNEPKKGVPSVTPPAASTINVGDKLFANSSTGVNAYNSANSGVNNIFKYYANGNYIGTYLGKDGIYYKVIADKNNILGLGTTPVTVWVMANQVKK